MKPGIRFGEFTDAWEQRKLGELTNIKTGSSDLQDAVDNGEYPFFVRSENVERSNRYIFDGEAILIPGEGRLGDIYHYINGKFDYHQRVYKISDFADSNTDGKFVLYYLQQNFKRHALKFTVKATVDSLRLPMLVDFEIKLPNIDEQREVGVFFSNLDNLITLHQRKLNKIKNFKSAYLSKMFPKEGERYPRLRFAGFTDAWEQRKLGDVAQITMGQSPNSKNYTDNPDDHILVQGNADMKNGRVLPRVWTTQVTKQAEKNDLILSVRAPVGDVGKTDYDVVLGRGVAGIKGNEFIFQLLTRMKENGYWRNLSTGSTFESINSNDIKEAYVLIPNNEEQVKIGLFFSNLDYLITLHQRKVEKLKIVKKSMLEKMFV